jgi:hypothetical protein
LKRLDKAAPGGFGREAAESTAAIVGSGWGEQLVLLRQVRLKFNKTMNAMC